MAYQSASGYEGNDYINGPPTTEFLKTDIPDHGLGYTGHYWAGNLNKLYPTVKCKHKTLAAAIEEYETKLKPILKIIPKNPERKGKFTHQSPSGVGYAGICVVPCGYVLRPDNNVKGRGNTTANNPIVNDFTIFPYEGHILGVPQETKTYETKLSQFVPRLLSAAKREEYTFTVAPKPTDEEVAEKKKKTKSLRTSKVSKARQTKKDQFVEDLKENLSAEEIDETKIADADEAEAGDAADIIEAAAAEKAAKEAIEAEIKKIAVVAESEIKKIAVVAKSEIKKIAVVAEAEIKKIAVVAEAEAEIKKIAATPKGTAEKKPTKPKKGNDGRSKSKSKERSKERSSGSRKSRRKSKERSSNLSRGETSTK